MSQKKHPQGTEASTSLKSSVSLLILIVEKRPLLRSYGQRLAPSGTELLSCWLLLFLESYCTPGLLFSSFFYVSVLDEICCASI